MRYYANPTSPEARQAMRDGLLGYIDTPSQGNKREPEVDWCADNGCFSESWDEQKWWRWIDSQERTMRFACVPDVVSDWNATLRLFEKWQPIMDAAQLPLACVAQDGATPDQIPWELIRCVFIGGSTDWKLGEMSESIIREGNNQGVWVHVGRVNSLKRLRWAKHAGADSVDGTMLVFNPTKRLEELLRWLPIVNSEQRLEFT